MKPFIGAILAIFWKDLLAERRTREILGTMLVFALTVILVFVFAFDLSVEIRRKAAAGVIWVTLCFAGTISLNRSLTLERDREAINALLLAPVDRTAIFFGKALVNWVYLLITAAIIVPVYALLNNLSLFSWGGLGVILLGTLGYILTGTLLSTLTLQLRARDMLLPVLLFPVIIPLLLACVRASTILLQGGNPAELDTWLVMLVGYDLLFAAVGLLVFDRIIEE
ncbi:MAG TPA: heme exporter protein CcmB [Anaerolineaceae bacterium]|nr:heme exporter protein CcmB [Anaerolineaceae bacterium]NMC17345.1 cytochrome C biogenesis protein [Chloroflexota bacterium]HNS07530.1 heme exporter protein CcmB [Anaerolineaceae bacterium]HOE02030.1 heme exporter protein CcmB [Anaerolineaceae bacterium]HOS53235.1 heme exporter protein CcmB [Anaerolineaceae bacterium]